jgi:prepilin signal peptidase PulO-like enzyme (type II secretory pathway)
MRSFCPHCQRQLRWFELIPVVSFAIARGRCRGCGNRISSLYPIIEIFVASIAVFTFQQQGISIRAFELLVFVLLMLTIALIDWRHLVIPNQVIVVGLITGIAIKASSGQTEIFAGILSSLCSFLALYGIMFLGNYFLKKHSMGMGDVKLAAVIGLFVGFQDFLVALWLASLVGIIYFVINSKLVQRVPNLRNKLSSGFNHQSQSNRLPFGSFLAILSMIVIYFQPQIRGIINAWLIWNL